jgi:hypothetical protein
MGRLAGARRSDQAVAHIWMCGAVDAHWLSTVGAGHPGEFTERRFVERRFGEERFEKSASINSAFLLERCTSSALG